ncbi:iron chaperone [Mangrovibacterium diazotrophicum]|uniref:Uncharacterized protein YdhG (YjbR/CyaY superfamily) n=1 Tax=Mangrovibacterium diazotrophicum TaxID=1261403 RepID=A0A419W9G5_9BACT|nr:DUF1801 domain-containing protein [Mangrovibacterium diazotrophicum]RKD92108.1 uncharacterized protein YdhG (YjbR/CyaY superfamily) [Mangrovibacterium diazotrophicum]
MDKVATIDEYHRLFPDVREELDLMRRLIREEAPMAEERISYGMPTFRSGQNFVHYAACKTHIGFYPTPSAIVAFQSELSGYKSSKGAIQFPFDQPLPEELIRKIVRFRVAEVLEKKGKKPLQK